MVENLERYAYRDTSINSCDRCVHNLGVLALPPSDGLGIDFVDLCGFKSHITTPYTGYCGEAYRLCHEKNSRGLCKDFQENE